MGNNMMKYKNFISLLFPIFVTTLCIEAAQYAFSIGQTDITDVIMNTAGGAVGIWICMLLMMIILMQKETDTD